MHLAYITLFPQIIHSYMSEGVIGRGLRNQLFDYSCCNPRDYTPLPHKQVDDRPYGGGSGMVLRADVLKVALEYVATELSFDLAAYDRSQTRVIVTAASGTVFTQQKAIEYSQLRNLILISGRYEGIDQRFIDTYADETISIGSFVVSGGELPSLVIADATLRNIKGLLGNEDSLLEESHSEDLLREYPHYTRPRIFEGKDVPEYLLSGHHKMIHENRQKDAVSSSDPQE